MRNPMLVYQAKSLENFLKNIEKNSSLSNNETQIGKTKNGQEYFLKKERSHRNPGLYNQVSLLEVVAEEIYLLILDHDKKEGKFYQPKPQLVKEGNRYSVALRGVKGYKSFSTILENLMPASMKEVNQSQISLLAKFIPALIVARFLDDDDPHEKNLGFGAIKIEDDSYKNHLGFGIKIDGDRAFSTLQAQRGLFCGYNETYQGIACYCVGMQKCGFSKEEIKIPEGENRTFAISADVFEYSIRNFPNQHTNNYFNTIETVLVKVPNATQQPLFLYPKYETIFRILNIPEHYYLNIVDAIITPTQPELAVAVKSFLSGRLQHLKAIASTMPGYNDYYKDAGRLSLITKVKGQDKNIQPVNSRPLPAVDFDHALSHYEESQINVDEHLSFYFQHKHTKKFHLKDTHKDYFPTNKFHQEKLTLLIDALLPLITNNILIRKETITLQSAKSLVITSLIYYLLKHPKFKQLPNKVTFGTFYNHWLEWQAHFYEIPTGKIKNIRLDNSNTELTNKRVIASKKINLSQNKSGLACALENILEMHSRTFIVNLPLKIKNDYLNKLSCSL